MTHLYVEFVSVVILYVCMCGVAPRVVLHTHARTCVCVRVHAGAVVCVWALFQCASS